MEKTKFIVIKDLQNVGKTTTIWLLIKALNDAGATIKVLQDMNENDIQIPTEIPVGENLIDVWAVLEWHQLIIVLDSRGDYVTYLEGDIRYAIKNYHPDFMVCAVQERPDNNNIWNNFNYKFPNTKYERICFGVEHADDKAAALIVKQPTIKAIMKYMA
ncbi:MAG: hypothetical protein IJS82_03780 [Paludibacteraceae bacterium]|nr:hypothetical protein [Paludibacteraceae bacterium]